MTDSSKLVPYFGIHALSMSFTEEEVEEILSHPKANVEMANGEILQVPEESYILWRYNNNNSYHDDVDHKWDKIAAYPHTKQGVELMNAAMEMLQKNSILTSYEWLVGIPWYTKRDMSILYEPTYKTDEQLKTEKETEI